MTTLRLLFGGLMIAGLVLVNFESYTTLNSEDTVILALALVLTSGLAAAIISGVFRATSWTWGAVNALIAQGLIAAGAPWVAGSLLCFALTMTPSVHRISRLMLGDWVRVGLALPTSLLCAFVLYRYAGDLTITGVAAGVIGWISLVMVLLYCESLDPSAERAPEQQPSQEHSEAPLAQRPSASQPQAQSIAQSTSHSSGQTAPEVEEVAPAAQPTQGETQTPHSGHITLTTPFGVAP